MGAGTVCNAADEHVLNIARPASAEIAWAADMDGTLLDSRSQVLPSSVDSLKAAAAQGVMLCLATGKARPGAIRAMQAAGLAGEPAHTACHSGSPGRLVTPYVGERQEHSLLLRPSHKQCAAGPGLVVSREGPGLFLQGLAVYGATGTLLPGVQAAVRPSLCLLNSRA